MVEPAPQDTQVLRGCGFESHRVLLLGPYATGVLRPAWKPRATWLPHMAALPLRFVIS